MMKKALLFFAPVLLVVGCASYSTMSSSTPYGATPGTSDADIAAIMTAASQGEIDQANVAISKATSSDVRDFAQMMLRDHTSALSTAQSVFSSNNISANDNDLSRTLKSGSQQTISALNTYRTGFDRVYMQAQVDAHQWLLDTLDKNLIPSARSSAVRNLLQSQRGTVASHLDRARQIVQSLP